MIMEFFKLVIKHINANIMKIKNNNLMFNLEIYLRHSKMCTTNVINLLKKYEYLKTFEIL